MEEADPRAVANDRSGSAKRLDCRVARTIRFCSVLPRSAGTGLPGLGWAAASAFGVGTAAAVQTDCGRDSQAAGTDLAGCACVVVAAEKFLELGQHVAALPVSAAQAAALSSLGDLPLVVLSGDHHAEPHIDWQHELAQLSSRGRHLVASDCGHWVHLDHPEVVTSAIREGGHRCTIRCSDGSLLTHAPTIE